MELLAFSFQTIDSWIEAGGYFVLFGLLFACGLGLPLPEDIPLIIAGILIANGKMHVVHAAIAAWCGIIGGDIMLYHLGKKFGLEITRLPFIGKHLNKERITQLEQKFDEYGIFVVAIGRLVAGVRGVMVVAAGAARFNFWKFVITDGISAFFSGGLFVLLGYALGQLDEQKIREFKYFFICGVIAIAATATAILLWRRRRKLNLALQNSNLKARDVVVDKVIEKVAETLKPQAAPADPAVKDPAVPAAGPDPSQATERQ